MRPSSLIRFSDATPEPPARYRRKHAASSSANGTGHLVRKAPANHVSVASFTLHLGAFGSGDVTVVKAYRIFTVSSPLWYAVLDRSRPGQAAVFQDESGVPILVHLADTEVLVVGNSKYRVGPLQNPGTDATAIAAALRNTLNFDKVILRRDLEAEGFRSADQGHDRGGGFWG